MVLNSFKNIGVVTVNKIQSVTPKRGKRNQLLASVTANLGGMCYGIAESWSSPILPLLSSQSESPLVPPLNVEEASWTGSLLFLGAMVSTPIFGYLIDKIGRKKSGYLASSMFIISWLVIYFASSPAVLLIGRFIIGLSSGGSLVLVPAYIGDITQADVRGALASFYELFINIGILFVYIVGTYVTYKHLNLICLIIPVIYAVGLSFVPESPVYLLSINKTEEAYQSLRSLRDGDERMIRQELETLMKLVHEKDEHTHSRPTVKRLLLSKVTRRGLMTSLILVLAQQMCGIVAILSYTASIFHESGSDLTPNTSAICVGAVQLFGSIVSSALIDRFGRRVLAIASNAGMAVCLVVLFAYFLIKSYNIDVSLFQCIPVIFLCLYVFSYAIGMGPIPFVIISELFSPQIQGIAEAIVLLFLWALGFTVAKTFSNMEGTLGSSSVYAFYLIFCIIGFLFSSFYLIETKNKSMENILEELGRKKKKRNNNVKNNDITTTL